MLSFSQPHNKLALELKNEDTAVRQYTHCVELFCFFFNFDYEN